MDTIHHGPQAPGRIQYLPITDIRKATCLMVLGFELEEKGICRIYDAEHPKSSGGVAHFYFKPHQAEQIQEFLAAYDAGRANVELDTCLDSYKEQDLAIGIGELEPMLKAAVIVWMREAIDSFWNILYFVQHQATELVVTGGEPAHDDEGKPIGKQGFKVKVLKRKS